MLYTIMCILYRRKSWLPCVKIVPHRAKSFDQFLSAIALVGTTTLTIVTMVRCKNHWQFVLLAIEHLCLSVAGSIMGFFVSTENGDETNEEDPDGIHAGRCLMIYFCIVMPGNLLGAVGYFSLLIENWSNKNVRTAFGAGVGGGAVLSLVFSLFQFVVCMKKQEW
jgi:hypothetical protein